MKKYSWLTLLILFSIISCDKNKCVYESLQYIYEPMTQTWDEINSQIGTETARDIEHPGKIFLLGNLLFINEVNEGIHVIDNTDPSNPENKYFINIPGSLDIAAIGGILYSDNYSDLIAIDITDLSDIKLIDRVPNAFNYGSNGFYFQRTDDGVITNWIQKDTIIEFDCETQFFGEDVVFFEASDGAVLAGTNTPMASNDAVGVAGSMARFALYHSNLFTLDGSELKVFDRGATLTQVSSQYLNWGVETIFPYQNYLFIGGNSGMSIMDITNPDNPTFISSYSHITSCDPVVVAGDYAYVTLRSGNFCDNFTNQLDIIDISEIESPTLLTSHQMFNPHGLGITNEDVLFLCDGDEGLKIFDATDKFNLELIKHYADINAYDVIPFNNSLFMIGADGFYQYDYSDIENIHLISKIPVLN